MLAKQWLTNARDVMSRIEETQRDNIQSAAEVMADSIECGRWVHTFGCGHATLPIEEMYPRIGGFVGFHPLIELPLSFFTRITGEMGVHQFVFLERVEGYGVENMKRDNFDTRDTMWLFSHSGINTVNIDVALEARKKGMKVVVFGSAAEAKGKQTRHSSGKTICLARVSFGPAWIIYQLRISSITLWYQLIWLSIISPLRGSEILGPLAFGISEGLYTIAELRASSKLQVLSSSGVGASLA